MCMCVSVRWLDPTALCHVLISTRLCADRCQCAHEPATEHKKALRQRVCTVVYVLLVVDVLFLADGTAQSKPHRPIVVPHAIDRHCAVDGRCWWNNLIITLFGSVRCWLLGCFWLVCFVNNQKKHTHTQRRNRTFTSGWGLGQHVRDEQWKD